MITHKSKKQGKPYKQKLHIDDKVWTYKIGISDVVIRSPDCMTKYVVSLDDITGIVNYSSANYILNKRGYWRCSEDFRKVWDAKKVSEGIKPSEVKKWIESNLVEKE